MFRIRLFFLQISTQHHCHTIATHGSLHHGTYSPRELYHGYYIPSISAAHPNSLHCPQRNVQQLAYQHVVMPAAWLVRDGVCSHAQLQKRMAWRTLLWKDLQPECNLTAVFQRRRRKEWNSSMHAALRYGHLSVQLHVNRNNRAIFIFISHRDSFNGTLSFLRKGEKNWILVCM